MRELTMAETYRMHPALKTKLAQVPNEPGCYLMRDRKGVLIYVGKAVSLRRRVLSYFRQATYRRGDPKLRGLLNSVADLEWIVVRNEAEALLMEGKLIKAYKPRYNISMRDDKRYLLLRVQPQDPFPVFEVCRVDRNDGALYFGPYVASRAARATLNYMERRWGLRRCKPVVPDTATHRHCLDDVVRYCSAPCVGKISSEAYHVQFDEACAFLRGERPAELEHIRKQMEEAAQSRDYEKAAVWRDLYALICEALEKRRKRALHPGNRVDHARQGVQALGSHLGMAVPPRVIEAFDISTISGTFSVASMVCCVEGSPARRLYRRFRIRSVAGMDDPRMMHEVLTRRYQRVLATGSAGPDLVVVDGGVTQWRARRLWRWPNGLRKYTRPPAVRRCGLSGRIPPCTCCSAYGMRRIVLP